jgi:DNA polymerase-3 subunit epsilon
VSAELAELERHEAIRRAVTRDLRGPLAGLRAAAENLSAFPNLDSEHRNAFQEIILKESTQLSQRIETLAAEYRGRSAGAWPMAEIHSPDLFNFLAHRLRESGGVDVTAIGESHWLKGDSHSLLLVLSYLCQQIASREAVAGIEIQAGLGSTRVFVELRWRGTPVSDGLLDEWLAAPLPGLPGSTAIAALERHGSEPWSQALGNGLAALRIPLQPPSGTASPAPPAEIAPRPEFYDFDLMYAHSFTGDMGDRKLKDLTYVVFDTEATGLRPTAGDQIVQIAAVRVTKGRLLSGESFDSLVNPGRPIPKDSIRFHGITDEMVRDQPPITEVLPRFHEFAGDAVLVAHNAAFDMKFLKLKEAQCGLNFTNPVIDTLLLSVLIEGELEDHSLDGICERLNISVENRHSALGDTLATAKVLVHLLDRLEAMGIHTFEEAMRACDMKAQLRFRATHF